MAKLHLISLECHVTEDWLGPDEPYLRINGQNVWGPISLNNGQSADIDKIIEFEDSALIQLFDQDTGVFWDYDDHLGDLNARASQAGLGEQRGRFTGDGANYTLTWKVIQEDIDVLVVTVFQHSNFRGRSQSFSQGVYRANRGDLSVIGNDTISSLKVPSGLTVRMCEHEYGGLCRTYTAGEYSYVGDDFNDKVSFIQVQETPAF